MNIFCCYIRNELSKKFKIEVDVFMSKKKLAHFAFYKPLISYSFFDEIIDFVVCRWEERINFFTNFKMIYPRLNHSIKWKSC